MLPPPVLDLQNEVPGGIEHRLDRVLTLAGVDEAGGEELAGIRILEADLAAVLAGDDPETSGPDEVGLEPLATLVAAAGGAGRDFVNGDFPDDQESVLESLVFLNRHRPCRRNVEEELVLGFSDEES